MPTLNIHIHGGGLAGHAYISITNNNGKTNTYGYFPEAANANSDLPEWNKYSGPGEVRITPEGNNGDSAPESVQSFDISEAQYDAVIDYAEGIRNNPGQYNGIGGDLITGNGINCVDFAQGAMNAASINQRMGDTFTDGQLYNAKGAGIYADDAYGDNAAATMHAFASQMQSPEAKQYLENLFSDSSYDWPFLSLPGFFPPNTPGGGPTNPGSSTGGGGGSWFPFGDWFPFAPAVSPLAQAINDFFDFPPTSPLILDLNRDGQIELTALSNSNTSFFDLDADGFAEQTGWVSSDDGLLAIDRNGDGIINDINELFGNETTDGFIELAQLDSNADGVIDASDAQFADLLVWQDADGDGYSDAGELVALSVHGINAIDLNYTTVNGTNQGHLVSTQSSAALAGGGSMLVQDIWFQHNQANSFYVLPDNFTYDEDVFTLPQLRGSGNAADLWVAMSDDAALLSMVQNIANADYSNFSFASFAGDVEAILFKWLGVDNVDPTSRGSHIDARIIEGMEVWVGRDYLFAGSANPLTNAGELAGILWDQLVADTAAKLLVQIPNLPLAQAMQDAIATLDAQNDPASLSESELTALLDPIFDAASTQAANHPLQDYTGLSYDYTGNTLSGSFADFVTVLQAQEPPGTQEKDAYWLDKVALINAAADSLGVSDADYIVVLSATQLASLASDSLIGLRSEQIITGTTGDDALDGGEANNYFAGLAGNDTITDTGGDDIYAYYEGDGHDVIIDKQDHVNRSLNDKILLGPAFTSADVVLSRTPTSPDDLVISFTNASGSITVKDHFDNTSFGYGHHEIEVIQFNDGTIWSASDIETMLLNPTQGDDLLIGYRGHDSIDGLDGNDTIMGGDWGNDTLLGGAGDDLIDQRAQSSIYSSGVDLSRGGLGDDTIYGGSIRDHIYGDEGNDVLDGGGWEDTVYGGAGDDLITDTRYGHDLLYGEEGNDTIDGGKNNDTIDGGIGNDSLEGASGNDEIYGNLGDDFISGGDGDDNLFGDAGNDTIVSGDGADFLLGNAGADIFRYSAIDDSSTDEGVDYIGDFAQGEDLIDLSALGYTDINQLGLYVGGGYSELFDSVTGFAVGFNGEYSFTNADFILSKNIIDGTNSADSLIGTLGGDSISGFDGNDYLNADSGDDILLGGAGNDDLFGGTGNDTLISGTGNDYLVGDGGQDVFQYTVVSDSSYADGTDYIGDFMQGQDLLDVSALGYTDVNQFSLYVGGGYSELYDTATGFAVGFNGEYSFTNADFLWASRVMPTIIDGTSSDDSIIGTSRNDHISALAGNDYIHAGAGDDLISGGEGNDDLFAGIGNDTLISAAGNDYLFGDLGNDVFRYTSVSDSSYTDGADYIGDFTQGEDLLDISALGYTDISELSVYHGSGYTELYDTATGFAVGFNGDYNFTNADLILA